jgi:hypothetical protein
MAAEHTLEKRREFCASAGGRVRRSMLSERNGLRHGSHGTQHLQPNIQVITLVCYNCLESVHLLSISFDRYKALFMIQI